MKILYGITKSNFGGAQRYVFDLARSAKERGDEVKVICGKTGPFTEKLNEIGVEVVSLPSMWRDVSFVQEFKSLWEIWKILNREKPDVFHVNSSKIGGLGAVSGRIAGVRKIIFTAHSWEFNAPRKILERIIIKFFAWLTIILSHKTICVSEKTRADVASLPLVKKKLVVILNGIEKFNLLSRKKAREKLGVPEEKVFLVGSIGELHKVKGQDILLGAWVKFSHHHSARLVIIGDGEERVRLENYARSLGISDSAIFTGFIDNARELLTAFDVFVFPSRSEGMPYSLIEAGFANLPIIATSVGGIPEIIESGSSGITIKPENPEELLSSLILLYDNPSLRQRLASNLKLEIGNKFSLRKMVNETFEQY